MERIREQWLKRTGVDFPCYTQILKGVLAPTIALACCQATSWFQVLGTVDYLVPVAAIICYPFQPRAQFLQALFLNTVTVCFTAASTLLAMFCIVKARHTTSDYDSSASAVAAVWLIAMTFIITAVRAKYPGMVWPCSAALIFSNYGTVYTAEYISMSHAMSFLRQLLLAHFIGFAISFGVSLLVFPTTSHQQFLEVVSQCLTAARSCLEANCALRKAIESKNVEAVSKEIRKVRQETSSLAALQVKLASTSAPAIKEIPIGGWRSGEVEQLYHGTREILTPLIGMEHLADATERTLCPQQGDEKAGERSVEHLPELLKSMTIPLDQACFASCDSIEVVMRDLGLTESSGDRKRPEHSPSTSSVAGHEDRIAHLQTCLDQLLKSKEALVAVHPQTQNVSPNDQHVKANELARRDEMFAVLHNEFLTWTTTRGVLQLLEFAQQLDDTPKMSNPWYRIRPAYIRRSWHRASHRHVKPFRTASDAIEAGHVDTYKDKSVVQRSNRSPNVAHWVHRAKPHLNLNFFATPAALFALRVSAAVMSIAIVAYLKRTQAFYIKQHLVWAQYTVSFAMQSSKGQSIRHFFLRFCGTTLAIIMALLAFYIVDGHAAGALVFYFLFMHIPIYIMVKHPRIQATGSVSAFALTIVLGNKLQLEKLGVSQAVQLGLAVQPMWLLGLIRLASIGGGLFLATVWTLLPYPISEHDQLQQTAATSLNLLARYYTSTHMATRARLRLSNPKQAESTPDDPRGSEDVRDSRPADIDAQLVSMSSQLSFAKWDVQVSAPFMRTQYDQMRDSLGVLMRSIELVRLASAIFADSVVTEENLATSAWLRKFRSVFDGVEETSHQATMLLMVLANSMNTRTPLPPFLRVPDSFLLSQYLDRVDEDVLSVRNVSEPGLATFAAIQVEIQNIHRCLAELLAVVKELVGEIDVGFDV